MCVYMYVCVCVCMSVRMKSAHSRQWSSCCNRGSASGPDCTGELSLVDPGISTGAPEY